jgi:hypothetical protein
MIRVMTLGILSVPPIQIQLGMVEQKEHLFGNLGSRNRIAYSQLRNFGSFGYLHTNSKSIWETLYILFNNRI